MKWLVLCMLVIVTSSCTKESDVYTETGKMDAVQFILSPESVTRATDTEFNIGDEVGIYAVERSAEGKGSLKNEGNYADNLRYRFDGRGFVPCSESDKIYLHGNPVLDYYVYYPYTGDPGKAKEMKFSVNTDQTEFYGQCDRMQAKYTHGEYQKIIPLTFYHKMALVELTIKNYKDYGKIEYVEIVQKKITCSLNLQKEEYITKPKREDIIMHLYETSGNNMIFRALVPEQRIYSCDETFRVFTKKLSYKYCSMTEIDLVKGRRQTFRINLQDQVPVLVAE